ncbi:urea transporter [Paraburkholderia flava]|uniref:urea transporter n=1 Tax=Paraburkholderia flava TaxID=2547393 RepID=UPI00105EDCDB|nr:urea transporter [Paraburkholderia flava]
MHAAAHDTDSPALRTLLRSVGQIVLQPNAFTGACVLAALLVCNVRLACAAMIGATTANVVAMLINHDDACTRDGANGFNGALAALATFSYVADPATATALAILSATAAAVLQAPWSRWLRMRGLAVYSSPYIVVTWGWLALLREPVDTIAPAVQPVTTSLGIASGVLSSFAQTAFASGALPGLLVLMGIAAASRRHACAALVGAVLANAVLWWCGTPLSSFDAGLLGFNGALAALALVDRGFGYALAGAALAAILQHATTIAGWPMMTAPFVVATWSLQMLYRSRIANAARTETESAPAR